MSTSDPDRPGPQGHGGRPPPAGTWLVRAALLAAAAALLLVLGWSVRVGVSFALADLAELRFGVEGEIGSAVRLLSALMEGASGPLVLAAASAAVLAAGLGVGPAARRPAGEAARARLGRLWRDLTGLSADTARWIRGIPRRRGVWHAAALAVVVLGGLALRALYLSQPVRYDEAFTFVHFAARPAELGVSRYTYPNNHLLHTLLVHLVTSVFGSAPAVMRLPAFVAGVAVVPAAYAAWDALGDAGEALVAAAVAAVSTPLVLYSTNARGYAIVVLCSLLLVPLGARLLRRRDLAAWGLFCAVAAAALYAIPLALYPVGATLAWVALSGRSRVEAGGGERGGRPTGRPRKTLLTEAGAAAVVVALVAGWLYLPAVQRSGLPAIVANRFVTPSPLGEFLSGLPGFFGRVWTTWTAGWPDVAAVALGAFALIGLAGDLRRFLSVGPGEGPGERPGAPYPPVVLAWSLLVLAATRRASFARLWLFLLPVFGLLAARGLATSGRWIRRGVGRRVVGPAAALLLLAGLGGSVVATDAVVESTATGPFRDGEEVSRVLEERMGAGDRVLAQGPAEVVLEYWFHHRGIPGRRLNRWPDPGGRLYVVVDRTEGQSLAGIMAKIGVAGSDRIRSRRVAEFEHSALYALLPPE